METIILTIFACILLLSRDRNLLIENLALRQQLAIMKQKTKRPKIRLRDLVFWMLLSRIWKDWKSVLIVVKPETVIRWHRKGFKLFWSLLGMNPGRLCISMLPDIRRQSGPHSKLSKPAHGIVCPSICSETGMVFMVNTSNPGFKIWEYMRSRLRRKVLSETLTAHGFAQVVSMKRGGPHYDLWAVAVPTT
jgi:hypothetical protein